MKGDNCEQINPIVSLASGFLFLVRDGAGELSLDNRSSSAIVPTTT